MRQDDGISSIMTKKGRLYFKSCNNRTVEERMQLFPEDSSMIDENDIVAFIDACINSKEKYNFLKVQHFFEIHLSSVKFYPSSLAAPGKYCFNTKTEEVVS